jgi:hypothetical protein
MKGLLFLGFYCFICLVIVRGLRFIGIVFSVVSELNSVVCPRIIFKF